MSEYRLHVFDKEGKKKEFIFGSGQSLYQVLRKNNMYVNSVCGGTGRCKKCKVQFLSGATPPHLSDRETFTDEELEQGYRLACKSYPSENCSIYLDFPSAQVVLTIPGETDENCDMFHKREAADHYGLAVDIGTTTIAYALVNLQSTKEENFYSQLNLQQQYGADVISRIQKANEGELVNLKECITKQLTEGIYYFLSETCQLDRIVISANTAMVHLLMGYSCEGLGAYPFREIYTDMISTATDTLLFMKEKIPITIMPGISAFIGGDILSGIAFLSLGKEEKRELFIDLGTNAEMALCDGKGHILVTSAAAGPAFEGGNISCGTGSVPGAVCHAKMMENGLSVSTIRKDFPVGICGSGLLDIIFELKKANIIDETGLFIEQFFETGYPVCEGINKKMIYITQNDVREFQYAKSAIRTAIEILLERSGLIYDELDHVYLAGAFGTFMNFEKAAGVGLFPEKWRDKIEIVGNTSLLGAVGYLTKANEREVYNLKDSCQEIYIANEASFQEKYLRYMYL